MVHRCLTTNSCHGADAVHVRCNNTLWAGPHRRHLRLTVWVQPSDRRPETGPPLPECKKGEATFGREGV